MFRPTHYPHVVLDEYGIPLITGTTTKVVEIVRDHLAGDDPGEMHRQYPYLSKSQIHSALAYYYDHQTELDDDIARRQQRIEEFKAAAGPSPLRDKLGQPVRVP